MKINLKFITTKHQEHFQPTHCSMYNSVFLRIDNVQRNNEKNRWQVS